MDDETKAALAIKIEQEYWAALADVIRPHVTNADEQVDLAAAVIVLSMRRLTRGKGTPWLEQSLTMILQPVETIGATGQGS